MNRESTKPSWLCFTLDSMTDAALEGLRLGLPEPPPRARMIEDPLNKAKSVILTAGALAKPNGSSRQRLSGNSRGAVSNNRCLNPDDDLTQINADMVKHFVSNRHSSAG